MQSGLLQILYALDFQKDSISEALFKRTVVFEIREASKMNLRS